MMTESVDQSFQVLPRDPEGLKGGRSPLPHERKSPGSGRGRTDDSGAYTPVYPRQGEAVNQLQERESDGPDRGQPDAMEKK